MNKIITDFLIAIALSMDAFSVAVCLSTSSLINKRKGLFLIIIVGIFHFIMPFFGSILASFISFNLDYFANYILGGIFLILGIEVITSKSNRKECLINYIYLVLIALTVSIDSFTVGLGLSLTDEYTIMSSFIFSLISAIFTTIGILLGKYLKNKVEKKANFLGGILLFLLSIKYFLKL